MVTDIAQLPGKDVNNLLQHRYTTIPFDQLYLLGHNYIDRVIVGNSHPPAVLRNMQTLYSTGCLVGMGYPPILPVDQGIEHFTGASLTVNPFYSDLKNIVELAIETGCNYIASTYGVLTSVSRRYVHRTPFLVKLNRNETLSYPNTYDQTLYASVEQAFSAGAVVASTTIYFGSEESRRQIEETSVASERVHGLGMAAVLWVYLRNSVSKKNGVDYHISANLTGQANHLAATIGANIVKQKIVENDGGYRIINYGYTDDYVYDKSTSENPTDLIHYQLANCYMGQAGLVNSGDAASGETNLSDAMRTAVINKRAGGMGLILGRKAFKKLMADGVKLTNAV